MSHLEKNSPSDLRGVSANVRKCPRLEKDVLHRVYAQQDVAQPSLADRFGDAADLPFRKCLIRPDSSHLGREPKRLGVSGGFQQSALQVRTELPLIEFQVHTSRKKNRIGTSRND